MSITKAKTKKGFLDGYKTYDTSNGFGDESQWKEAFNQRMGYGEAKTILSNDDPYSILEIAFGASLEEIKKAYRKLAMKWHPDKNQGVDTTEKMQKITAAYTILTSNK
jgi:DnaJ-domain-containing protein 1